MKSPARLVPVALLAACAFPLLTARAVAQGPLTPPSSPAVPLMKTLTQVEPRIAIPPDSPYTISTPGSYYLTGNLTNTAPTPCITITASQVTLDLNGYTINNAGGSGISTSGVSMVTVRNGIIRSGTVGIEVDTNASTDLRAIHIEHLEISDCTLYGILVNGVTKGALISDCVVSNIGSPGSNAVRVAGITGSAGTVVERCVIDTVQAAVATRTYGIFLASGAFEANNRISNCGTGIVSGKAQNNLTFDCAVPFTNVTDAGGNN